MAGPTDLSDVIFRIVDQTRYTEVILLTPVIYFMDIIIQIFLIVLARLIIMGCDSAIVFEIADNWDILWRNYWR